MMQYCIDTSNYTQKNKEVKKKDKKHKFIGLFPSNNIEIFFFLIPLAIILLWYDMWQGLISLILIFEKYVILIWNNLCVDMILKEKKLEMSFTHVQFLIIDCYNSSLKF